MRITHQLLRSKAAGPLQATEYLDLSCLGLVSIEKLQCCPKLQALNLRGNSIVEVTNLEQNRNIWRLDLSNNEIKDVDCLTRFVALGTLNLANNDLTWQEVGKLRHMHILELSLHGNKKLEKDPYYRIHIIDCLPHVWMLDGRLVTSAERLQVKHFFADSALTDHPIRRKLSKEWFVPSTLKKIEVNGIYGDKATHLMTRFPSNGPCNIDVDRRRLKYLAHAAQEDLILERKYTKRDFQVLKYRRGFMEDILEVRPGDRERCNMLLLMLVATLEFVMPTHLVKETLETAKLGKVGKVYSMDLFLLPKDIRCRLVCILLGAVKIDKDSKEDGGLYDKLYLCLFYTVAELSKLSNTVQGTNKMLKTSKMTQLYRDYKCLLASEVVQLLCIVPAFFEYVDKDVGVMNLVVTATGDPMVTEKIGKLTENIHQSGGDIKKLYEELSDFLLQKVQEQSLNLSNKAQKLPQEDQVITTLKAIPMKSPRSAIDASDFHAKGVSSPYTEPPSVLSSRAAAEKSKKHFPHLGDYLLLGPQTLGKIIGLPQPFVAHVAMDSIPVANGAMESKLRQSEDHYTYVNMDQFSWDNELSFWKPRGSIGDSMLQEFLTYSNVLSSRRRVEQNFQPKQQGLLFTHTVPLVEPKHYIFHCRWFTIHTIEDLRKELNRRANVSTTDQVPRPNSPEDTRSYPVTPGRDVATPLIFNSGGLHSTSDEFMSRRPQYQASEFSPRPMTSLLKEKLDLKLDMSVPPRSQSASAVERPGRGSTGGGAYSPHSPRSASEAKILTDAQEKESSSVKGGNSDAPVEKSAEAPAGESEQLPVGPVGDSSSKPEEPVPASETEPSQEPAPTTTTTQNAPATQHDTQHTPPPASTEEPPAESRDSNKENEAPGVTPRLPTEADDSLAPVSDEDEPELQKLATTTTARSGGRPASAPGTKRDGEMAGAGEGPVGTGTGPRPGAGSRMGATSRTKSSSSLQINIPQVELLDTDNMEEKKVKGKAPVIKGNQPTLSSRSTIRKGRYGGGMPGNASRPFSAMDAYRYFVNNPRGRGGPGTETGGGVYNTTYQQQRTEAWRQSASATLASSSQPHTHVEVCNRCDDTGSVSSGSSFVYTDNASTEGPETIEIMSLSEKYSRQGTPPPQRPTSPDAKARPSSSFSIKKANDWLGGGRDLYWEALQRRPKSGHIPGWKEGLPDSMKRPRSAVAHRAMNRQSKRTPPVTPSSLAYEAMLQGARHHATPPGTLLYNSAPAGPGAHHLQAQIPDLMDLAEYQPLYHHIAGLPRRLGSPVPGGAAQDSASQSAQDTVYRIPPGSPTRNVTPSYRKPPYCLQCIYEDSIDGHLGPHDQDILETRSQKSAQSHWSSWKT